MEPRVLWMGFVIGGYIFNRIRDLASLANGATVFAGSAEAKLVRLREVLAPLAERYDVVVANPPYMGGNNMGRWLNAWTKRNYKEACRDLCTCFVRRGMVLAGEGGYEALITSDTCMYISSFEKMRKMVIDETTIVAFIDTRGTNAHPDVFDANAGWVLWLGRAEGLKGSYFKLNHPIAEKEARYLEALADPGCGWLYRYVTQKFRAIPGAPIVYWASERIRDAFANGIPLGEVSAPRQGLATGENERFVRRWWEIPMSGFECNCESLEDLRTISGKWIPYNKGGEFRKWYGNNDFVISFDEDSYLIMLNQGNHLPSRQLYFKSSITWSKVSSGVIAFRYKPKGGAFDVAGTSIFGDEDYLKYIQALCNSSLIMTIAGMLSPTLNFEVGQISLYPVIKSDTLKNDVIKLVDRVRHYSTVDYDTSEVSWDFAQHPLV